MGARVGAIVTVTGEKAVAGGRVLARLDGQIVLLAGAIPGERVRARVERAARGMALAQVTEVLDPSSDRREAGNWRCGGNALAFVAYARQLQMKREIVEDAFARTGRLVLQTPARTVASRESGYRLRARLHAGTESGRIRLGYYVEGSHALCDPSGTGQLTLETNAWIADVSAELTRQRLSEVREVDLAETIAGDARAAHFVLNAGAVPSRVAPLAFGAVGLSAQVGEQGTPVVVMGTPVLVERITVRRNAETARLNLTRNVRAFFQGNRYLVEALVEEVVQRLAPGPVVDLYAGVGLFGLAAAALGSEAVTLVEGDPLSGDDLSANAAVFGRRVRTARLSVEAFLRSRHADVLGAADATAIVDPPRTGLSPVAIEGLLGAAPARVVYVSCDPPTLARDARLMRDAGYAIGDVTVMDLFPNTAHVETIATFLKA
jgi:23S rRNA (uracil1939-C5)-methyltransferase